MKTGQSLQELAAELERQEKEKRDFKAPTNDLTFKANGKQELTIGGHGTFGVTEIGNSQIASRLGIPQKYYDRMKNEAPGLLEGNVNHWFQEKPEVRLVRTLDGQARAFLSQRYRPLDNYDMANAVLPTLSDMGVEIVSSALTETRLYIKAVSHRLQANIKVGDAVEAGIVISNSEIGMGSVKVEPMIYRLVCSNGMIVPDASIKKFHIGRGFDVEQAEEFLTDATREQDDRAFWMKVRDVVKGSMNQDIFQKVADRMRNAIDNKITGDTVKSVEVVQKRYGFNDGEKTNVLQHLIKGADLSQYGMVNAVTRASQDVESYDRATELERTGGQILELSKSDWREIAEVA